MSGKEAILLMVWSDKIGDSNCKTTVVTHCLFIFVITYLHVLCGFSITCSVLLMFSGSVELQPLWVTSYLCCNNIITDFASRLNTVCECCFTG